jgi:hypothetical protein
VSLDVQRLCARLAAAPPIFLTKLALAEPRAVHVDAVVADLSLARADRPLDIAELVSFAPTRGDRSVVRHLELVLVTSWLLYDEAFMRVPAERLFALLDERVRALSALVVPRLFIEDSERREELVRSTLDALGLLPMGEERAVAEDRLAALDSVRRAALLRDAKTREQERVKRRAELEALKRQEEEESRKAARTTFED